MRKKTYHCPVCEARVFDASVCEGIVEIKCPKCKKVVTILLSTPSVRLIEYAKKNAMSC
jgi:phage FluMu protein Com